MVPDLRRAALRCLRDCSVVRVGAGRIEYGGLVSEGVADVVRVPAGDAYAYHYSLTDHGKRVAERELRP